MSSSPGWPPHSKPSTLTASQPIVLGLQRMAHRGAFVDHLDAGVLQRRHVLLRAAAGGLDDLDAALDDRARCIPDRAARVKRRQEGEVHAERLVGHLAAARDFLGQQFRRLLGQAGDDAEPAGIRHRGGQLGEADDNACRPG